jgi:hypothetical protein
LAGVTMSASYASRTSTTTASAHTDLLELVKRPDQLGGLIHEYEVAA